MKQLFLSPVLSKVSPARYRLLRLMAMFICLMTLSTIGVYAQPTPDRELFDQGYRAYQNGQWVQAAMYLKAYLERNPDELRNNATRRNQVINALRFAEAQASTCLQRLPTVSTQLSECREELTGVGSSASGLTTAPPTLPPLETAQPTSYPLVCRGGEHLIVRYLHSSAISTKPHFLIYYRKAAAGVGMAQENTGNLQPGECAWLDRPISTGEPERLLIGEPILNADQVDLTFSQGVLTSATPAYVQALQSDANLQVFAAYNDGNGNFVITSIGETSAWQKLSWEPGQILQPDDLVFDASPGESSGSEAMTLFDDDPRNNVKQQNEYFCSGFSSECEFGGCTSSQKLLFGPWCREGDYDYIQPGQYRVTILGAGEVTLGATDYGSTHELFAFSQATQVLPTSFVFCWPGLAAGGYGFETIVQSVDSDATIEHITIEYLGAAC